MLNFKKILFHLSLFICLFFLKIKNFNLRSNKLKSFEKIKKKLLFLI